MLSTALVIFNSSFASNFFQYHRVKWPPLQSDQTQHFLLHDCTISGSEKVKTQLIENLLFLNTFFACSFFN